MIIEKAFLLSNNKLLFEFAKVSKKEQKNVQKTEQVCVKKRRRSIKRQVFIFFKLIPSNVPPFCSPAPV